MPTQTTCVDCGHAYLAKRGQATSNTDFDSGATTSWFAVKVTDWTTNSGSGYLNICAINIENGSTGTQSGYVQIYYEVATDQIRCYVGEGFTTQDFLIRSGATTEWFRIAISCNGGLTDPVTLHYIFEDQSTATSVVVSDVGGDTNKGGRLRQFIIGGANFGSDEESYNLRVAQVGIFKVAFSASDVESQRDSETPIYTGSSLMSWYDWSDWSGDPWDDIGATYSAAGTFDLQEFDTLEGSTVNDYPGGWDSVPETNGTLGVLLSGASLFAGGEIYDAPSTGSGRVWLDFGYNGSTQASYVVTGQTGVISTTKVECWLMAEPTVWHNTDEHRVLASMKEHKPIVSEVGTGTFKVTMTSPWILRGVWKCRFFWSNA